VDTPLLKYLERESAPSTISIAGGFGQKRLNVVVTGVKLSFMDVLGLSVQLAVASIPAVFIALLIYRVIFGLL
jgi:hypothetical protein